MPITLLHLGLLAPINHFAPNKVSNVSFILVTLWLDANSILYALFGLPGIAHGTEHSFAGAGLLSGIVAACYFGHSRSKWVYGAFIGGLTHVLLDMLFHAEMEPLFPFKENPFYMDWMQPLSLVLLPLTVWFIGQSVSSVLGWVRKSQEPVAAEKWQPFPEEH